MSRSRPFSAQICPIIAEDLGVITDEVRALRNRYGLPGMKILQFAFEDNDSSIFRTISRTTVSATPAP